MFTLIVQVVINESKCMTPKRLKSSYEYLSSNVRIKGKFSNIYLSSIQVKSIVESNITEKNCIYLLRSSAFWMDAVLFYPCLEDETISLCLCRLLQSRFFVCLFVCLFLVVNLFFLLLLCLLIGLVHQGIFRLSGSTTEINDMKQLFENGNETERSMLWAISLLLCDVHFTGKALAFAQTTYT